MPCATKGEASPPVTTPVGRDGCLCVVTWQTAGRMSLQTCALESAADALVFLRNNLPGIALCGLWVDMQKCSEEEHRQVLQLLYPNMQPSHVEAVLANDMYDVVELQPTEGEYVVGCLSCSPSHGGPFPAATAMSRTEFGCEEGVLCSFVCSERVLLTLHTAPFAGLAELFRHVLKCNGSEAERHSRECEDSVVGIVKDPSSHRSSFVPVAMGTDALCTLVCFTCEASFPAPASLLSEVGDINEVVFLISPGEQDQTDLLRRVALLRRRISSFRTALFLKEKLIHQLISPAMRLTFVSKSHPSAVAYKEILARVQKVSEKLDDARDMLNHANLNFITGVSMRMSQASAGLDFKMNILNSVAAVSLPINLVVSLFGMNLKVPFMTGEGSTLIPFWTICAVFVVWAGICLTPLFRRAQRGLKNDPIAPYE
ncbi:CorA-like Mg2+ transporter protein, putative [Trypanosoma equiperdum]|uniref:CorA-like Mg2+ transporter protein, putative n=1 Tax=Trypanosoma equiperdum TaxID=5694 RepID=A0A1G4IC37_TRYEQ|nr:CorA-like Mg2+ transporter protein, putative [Trypanosoma equiperdum]